MTTSHIYIEFCIFTSDVFIENYLNIFNNFKNPIFTFVLFAEKGGEPAISENLQAKSVNPFIIKENSKDAQSVHAFGVKNLSSGNYSRSYFNVFNKNIFIQILS